MAFNGTTYSQDFQTMTATTLAASAVSTTTMLEVSAQNGGGSTNGWYLYHQSSGTPRWGRTNGSSNTGGFYVMFDGATTPGRALGSLASASITTAFGIVLENTSGSTINSVTISYDAVMNRNPATTVNSYPLSYRVSSSGVLAGSGTGDGTFNDAAGTWTAGTGFSTPASGTGAPGTQAAITPLFQIGGASITQTLTGLGWGNGQYLYIRWKDVTESGANALAGVDNFSISAAATPAIAVNLSGFNGAFGNVSVGGSSASSTFSVSATDLTSDLLITPPAGFEVRTGVSPFGTSAINLGSGNVASTPIDVRFTPLAAIGYSADVVCSSTGATSQLVPVSGTGIAVVTPTKLAFTSINGGGNVIENTPFSVTIQAQDDDGNPQNVTADTDILISLDQGFWTLAGTLTGTILAGTHTVVINGLTYDFYDTGVVLKAERTSGDVLADAFSAPFNVLGAAQDFAFTTTPAGGVVNTALSNIVVSALRFDATVATEFTGPVTIAIFSGPGGGSMLGTLTQNAVAGVATFSGISFDAVGAYVLEATGSLNTGFSPTINITNVPVMTELVVPQFIGSKSAAGSNVTRTPLTACVQWDNLLPNTQYKVDVGMALLSDAANLIGAGNKWNGASFGTGAINNAFVTDATGSSGPFWFHMEVTGNTTRFDAGQVHHLRFKTVPQSSGFPTNPNFVGSKTFTALDLPTTARTVSAADDGAYLRGHGPQCISGTYVMAYNNVAGTGDPLSVYQVRQSAPSFAAADLTQHPAAIQAILAQTAPSAVGDYALVIPIGANNPNGVRRIELRDGANNIVSAITDADGIWPGGANTTTNARRSVSVLGALDGALAPDADGDDICDDDDNCPANANPLQEDEDFDGAGDACDVCPSVAFGNPGDACDDGNPLTVLDALGASPTCGCSGTPCTTDLDIVFQPDGSSDIGWELRQQGTNSLVQSGGGVYPASPGYSVATCLPDGCFYLVVTDDGGDGITDGGYLLKINSAERLIDNLRDAFGRGGFTSGSTSQIASGEGFCLPIGTDRLILTSCDRMDWRLSPCNNEFVVANDNPAVTAQYNVTNATSGYQLWWYNPNGGYSFKRIQYHSTANGLAASATRACHFRFNNWSGNQLQENVLYNVKVRGIVNGGFLPWGAACRFMINSAEAQCARTKLNDLPGNPGLSCGQTRSIGTSVQVHARPVRRMTPSCGWQNANRYQFRFRIPTEAFELIKTSATGQYFVNTVGLSCGKTYEVDVRASFDNGATWCHTGSLWGDICLLNTVNCLGGGNLSMANAGSAASLRMYPNPNRGDQLFLNLEGIDAAVETVSVDIFDAFGKRVSARTIGTQDGMLNTILQLNGSLAAGLYTVSITAGEQQFTERLVVQP